MTPRVEPTGGSPVVPTRGVLRPLGLGSQDDLPVREATAPRGHAVRALYLSAGAVDRAYSIDHARLAPERVRRIRR